MSVLTRMLDPNNLRPLMDLVSIGRDVVSAVAEDSSFLGVARRALVPLPGDRQPRLDPQPLPPFVPLEASALSSERIGVVVSGGSGATSSAIGVQRAFEEAGLTPAMISASSGAVLFAAPWACGLRSDAVARFWLTLPTSDYLDPDWRALAASMRHRLGGWSGFYRGEALERSARRLLGDQRLGDTRVPFAMPAWNVDLNRIEVLGSRETPDLSVATVLRIAVAVPIFYETVRLNGHQYGDGGIVDIFPVRPVIEAGVDRVVGLNCYLPKGFEGEDVTGWHQRPFAILRASGQLRWSGMVALAQEQARLAAGRLLLLHPVPYEEVRGARFYETYVDRSRWPDFIRMGHREARQELAEASRIAQSSSAAEISIGLS
jgi:NTE family protein